jgi:hypothetical protein
VLPITFKPTACVTLLLVFLSVTNIITPKGSAGMSASAGVEIDLMQIYGRGIGRLPFYFLLLQGDLG